jgi:pimeloyl-ACP methyl ester carboxylesterase
MPAPAPPSARAKANVSRLHDPLRPRNPLVQRRWLLAGVAFIVLGAFAALYFALALLFWQGQWQLIFHPARLVAATPANAGVPFEEVRFDTTETGQTLLDGWWVPAAPSASNASQPGTSQPGTAQPGKIHSGAAKPAESATILYLHDARGSLSDAMPDILALHALGVNVFAFDPRGYGKSQWARPSEARWSDDAEAALAYLASLRHVPLQNVILVGRGLGGTIAANLTSRHPELRSLVMIDPQPPALGLLQTPRWTHILPIRLLAHDRFDPAHALHSEALDKLFLLAPASPAPTYVENAAAPVTVVENTTLADPRARAALTQLLIDRR